MFVEIIQGDICDTQCDAIVNPSHSHGLMRSGVPSIIMRRGGVEIQEEAISRAPHMVGKAVLTTSGSLPHLGIIHSAPGSSSESVAQATRAALECAEKNALNSLAIPNLGGKLSHEACAQAMMQEIKSFKATYLKKVILVDHAIGMVQAFKAVE